MKTDVSSILTLEDVSGAPQVKMGLPPTRVGDQLVLKFTLKRKNGPRSEELAVDGFFRVTAVKYVPNRSTQILSVEAMKVVPCWRAVKTQINRRLLGPTVFPPTEVK